MNREKLATLWERPLLATPLVVALAAGAVASIAGGYWLLFQLVVWIGARS